MVKKQLLRIVVIDVQIYIYSQTPISSNYQDNLNTKKEAVKAPLN